MVLGSLIGVVVGDVSIDGGNETGGTFHLKGHLVVGLQDLSPFLIDGKDVDMLKVRAISLPMGVVGLGNKAAIDGARLVAA